MKRLFKKASLLFFLSLFFIGQNNCSTPAKQKRDSLYNKEPDIFWPLPPEPPRIKYLYSLQAPGDIGIGKSFWGKLKKFLIGGTGENRMVKPYAIAVDKSGRVAVADPAKRMVHIYNPSKKKYRRFPKDIYAEIKNPVGVAFDENGNLYVSDSKLKRVNVYDKRGKLNFSIDNGFERPTGVAVNRSESLLYVVDTLLNKVIIFDLKGNMIDFFGGRGTDEGKFNFPTNISIDKKGIVYVSDSMNFRIQVFTKDGDFIRQFGKVGDGTGNFSNPKGVAVDSERNIYVVETRFDTVQIFNQQGGFLLNFGSRGNKRGEFWLPTGIFIDGSDLIYVADSYNSRVQVFQFLGSTEGAPY
ncbi:MAG: 6-bladed beta-propeller [Nitrospinota bacterium]